MNHQSQPNLNNTDPETFAYNEFYKHYNNLKIMSQNNNYHTPQNSADPMNNLLQMNQFNEKLK